jgi:hypothetical protein
MIPKSCKILVLAGDHSWGTDDDQLFATRFNGNLMAARDEIIPIIYPISRLMHLEKLEFSIHRS